MAKTILATGNHTAAAAVKAARVQVVSAYPITPQSPAVEKISDMIDTGELNAQFIPVESEHSAMASVIGASALGVRTFTATSSQGLALMNEMLHWASGSRFPIVMYDVNRGFSPPWNIWCDHQDTISSRDTGWLQYYAEDNQEIFDLILMAYKIAEDKDVRLPTMVCADGFTLSHATMPVEIPDQKAIDRFLPSYQPQFELDNLEAPATHSTLAMPNLPFSDWYTEFRYLMEEGMENAKTKFKQVGKEFKKHFGRSHEELIESYHCDDAEVVIVSMGSMAAQAKDVVDSMRAEGMSVGALKIKVFRPFPIEELCKVAESVKGFAVIERSLSFGNLTPVLMELQAALYDLENRPLMKSFVMGLGGRDIKPSYQRLAIEKTFKALKVGSVKQKIEWIGLRR
ncbi:unnamed protein product [marine sediment metagenome]|uniref:Pyruvate flavodoxin/ferredoxin oxidoreductase pyrimidine binding domain-containing protein n=1 Tax=marine sediment metagenome TaxID=412755 RepID=X0ZC49_9ZZZZ